MSASDIKYEDILRRNGRHGFTTMVKPVGSACNMRCRYCYYLDKACLYGGREPVMDEMMLDLYIRRSIEGNSAPVISFAWHGGEPLMAGLHFFRRAVELQHKYGGGRQIENSIQTNGLLVDREWCDFFRDNRFLVGISLDGPERVHDANRRDAAGGPTFARVMAAVERMAAAGVEYNTLTTVNSESRGCGAETYRFLRDVSRFMQFLPVAELVSDGRVRPPETDGAESAPWSSEAAAFGEFMCEVFDEWVVADVGSVFVQLFDATLANMLGMQPPVCSLCETCGTGLTVEHNGDVYPCDHFVYPEYRLGNILTDRLCDLAYCDRQFEFGIRKRSSLPRECRRCRHYRMCHGECPQHRFATDSTGEYGLNVLCEGYRLFFGHTEPYMERMKELILAGRAPAEVMAMARERLGK